MATVFCSTFIDLPQQHVSTLQFANYKSSGSASARCSLAHLESDILGVDLNNRRKESSHAIEYLDKKEEKS